MPALAHVALGSNLGDRAAILDRAVAALSATPGITVEAVSRHHETAPVGGPDGQPPFLNAAASLRTSLTPEALLRHLHAIEAEAGRVRTIRWGERTLDLDLLLYGDHVVSTPTLVVPHPRMTFRRFVLAPLADIAPDALHPPSGRTVAQLLAHIDGRPSVLALPGWWGQPELRPLVECIVDRLHARLVRAGNAQPADDDPDTWIVTDVPLTPNGREAQAPSLPAIPRLYAPTLVARSGPALSEPRPIPAGIPVLEMGMTPSESIVDEIVAACLATRPG